LPNDKNHQLAHPFIICRKRLLHMWQGLEQSLIDDAVDQWPTTRLRACVRANGGHFEHTL